MNFPNFNDPIYGLTIEYMRNLARFATSAVLDTNNSVLLSNNFTMAQQPQHFSMAQHPQHLTMAQQSQPSQMFDIDPFIDSRQYSKTYVIAG